MLVVGLPQKTGWLAGLLCGVSLNTTGRSISIIIEETRLLAHDNYLVKVVELFCVIANYSKNTE